MYKPGGFVVCGGFVVTPSNKTLRKIIPTNCFVRELILFYSKDGKQRQKHKKRIPCFPECLNGEQVVFFMRLAHVSTHSLPFHFGFSLFKPQPMSLGREHSLKRMALEAQIVKE